MRVGFYNADTLEDGSVTIEEQDTAFFAVIAAGNDSTFYKPDTIISVLTLPVDPASNETLFEIYTIQSVLRDTVSFNPLVVEVTYTPNPQPHVLDVSYRRFTQVITEDCGVEIGYVGLRVDETTFQSYNVDSESLSRFNEENERVNIEIFF